MAKYLLAYKGGGGMAEDPAAREAAMAAWGAWMGAVGPALVDMGAPFGLSSAVTPGGGSAAATAGLSGYSILTADSMEEAAELAKGCPVLASDGTVEIYEALDVM